MPIIPFIFKGDDIRGRCDRALIEKHIAESLKDIRRGRVYGPFSTADEMIRSLRSHMRRKQR